MAADVCAPIVQLMRVGGLPRCLASPSRLGRVGVTLHGAPCSPPLPTAAPTSALPAALFTQATAGAHSTSLHEKVPNRSDMISGVPERVRSGECSVCSGPVPTASRTRISESLDAMGSEASFPAAVRFLTHTPAVDVVTTVSPPSSDGVRSDKSKPVPTRVECAPDASARAPPVHCLAAGACSQASPAVDNITNSQCHSLGAAVSWMGNRSHSSRCSSGADASESSWCSGRARASRDPLLFFFGMEG